MKPVGAFAESRLNRAGEDELHRDGDTPGWLVSLFLHLALLVMLALAWRSLPPPPATLILHTADIPPEVLAPQEFAFSPEPTPDIGADGGGLTAEALALAPTIDDLSDVPHDVEPVEIVTDLTIEPMLSIPTGEMVSKDLVVKGAAGEAVTGTQGAVDRITHEILLSLEQRKLLVVWVFDQSGSLQVQRAEIFDRFHRIYEELDAIQASGAEAFSKHRDTPLLTSVVAFGRQVEFHTPQPTADIEQIKQAAAKIENDESGVEMVFSTVRVIADRFKSYRHHENPDRRRNVMIVLFTDEAGDDDHEADQAISLCQRLQIPVYVVGVPAPFGRRETLVKWIDPDPNYDQSVQWLPVRQGPESLMQERLNLTFGESRELNRWDRLDSGFGPYALTRLCYETNGIYFAVHPNHESRGAVRRGDVPAMSSFLEFFFDPAVMRNYRPEYLSAREYQQFAAENKARAALVEAARLSEIDPLDNPRLRFPVRSEAQIKQDLDVAQRAAASLAPRIGRLHEILKTGEADRQQLTTPRWQAGYDLAMGRVLAVRARAESYNLMLAGAKGGMRFTQPDSDTWLLRPADEISVGSTLEKMADQAREYLHRVIAEHPATPWAMLAQRELDEPIGWKWEEAHTGVNDPRPRPPQVAGPPARRAPEVPRRIERPKPKRENVRL